MCKMKKENCMTRKCIEKDDTYDSMNEHHVLEAEDTIRKYCKYYISNENQIWNKVRFRIKHNKKE